MFSSSKNYYGLLPDINDSYRSYEGSRGTSKHICPCLKHLGKLEDKDVFVYMFYHGEVDGFPFVFLYEEGKPVEKITGHDALVIVSSFSE
jgi:hypothetical protein